MKATLERTQGDKLTDVAAEVRVPLRTLQGWVAAARQVGVDAAAQRKKRGRPPNLTASEGNEVIEDT